LSKAQPSWASEQAELPLQQEQVPLLPHLLLCVQELLQFKQLPLWGSVLHWVPLKEA
jgi:hypothetical protein